MKRIRLLFLALLVMMMASSTSAMANIAEGVSGTCRWVIDDEGTLTISPLEGTSGTLGDWSEVQFGTPPWLAAYESITSAKFEGTIYLTTAKGMFMHCTNLKSVDFTGANTDNVTSMYMLFFNCPNLKNINFADINTSNVTDMSHLFDSCLSLETIDISNFNTENVTNMSCMFGGCISLETIDISNFNTENVTNMSIMFGGCMKLKSLDLSNLNMQSVTNHSNMFEECSSLRSIYSTKETPGTLKPGTFSELPTIETCNLFVPAASKELYRTADGWKELINVGGLLNLTDANPTLIADSYAPGQVSYTRNVVEGIATFCLPFDIDLSAVEGDAIESAYTIYPTAFLKETNKLRLLITEADGNIPAGTPFIAKCQSGEVLFTNTADVTYTADTTNPDPTPLTVFEDNGINSVLHHCTSLNVRAGGTYKRWDNPGEGYYVFNTKGNFGPVPTGAYISPFRMYISKTGASASSNTFEIELLFDDENDLTDLKDALISAVKQSAPAYNIMGQKVDANAKGIVIINGNKYYNK